MTRRDAAKAAGIGLLVLGLGLGVLVYQDPLWLVDRILDTKLRMDGVHSAFVSVDGYKIHYLVGGAGRPLVLVHGLGGRASDWAPLLPRLIAGGRRVYALDLLGCGLSDKPKDAAYSIAHEASIVEGFLPAAGLDQVDLAGWSMGGWVAMRVALRQPEHVRRLVLLDSAGLRFKFDYDPSILRPETPEQLAMLLKRLIPDPPTIPRFLALALLRQDDRPGWVVQRTVQSMLTGDDLVDAQIGSLTMPVLIGWGDQDGLIPLSVGYKLHALIPQSVLDIYTGCGHLAPGRCSDQVGASIVEFLNAQPAQMAMVRRIPGHGTFPGSFHGSGHDANQGAGPARSPNRSPTAVQ